MVMIMVADDVNVLYFPMILLFFARASRAHHGFANPHGYLGMGSLGTGTGLTWVTCWKPTPMVVGSTAFVSLFPFLDKWTLWKTYGHFGTGRNEKKTEGEEKHLIGVLDKTGWPDWGKPHVMVERQDEWSPKNSFNPEWPQPPSSMLTNALKTMRFPLSGISGIGRSGAAKKLETKRVDKQPPPQPREVTPTTFYFDECIVFNAICIAKCEPPHPLPPVPHGMNSRPIAHPTRSIMTITPPATKSSRNERRDKGKCLPSVLDHNKQSRLEIPWIAVEQDCKWFKNHTPTDEASQTLRSSSNISPVCMTCFDVLLSSPGGNSPTKQSVTSKQLESSLRMCDKCQMAQRLTDKPTGLKSSPETDSG